MRTFFRSMRIRYKIMIVVGATVALGLLVTAYSFTLRQEKAVFAQNEQTMRKLTESVIEGLQSVMLAGSADIAHAFADNLKLVPEIADFRILRISGEEAFRDNRTIEDVNRRRGEETFLPREAELHVEVLRGDDPMLRGVLDGKAPVSFYGLDAAGAKVLTFLAPITSQTGCSKCHGSAQPIRGIMMLSTSLAAVERDVMKVRHDSVLLLLLGLMATMLMTGYMMGRAVVAPIETITNAMTRVSKGDFDHKVPVRGEDELGLMAQSFNRMTSQVKTTYDGLRREQDKLTTIILGAGEGIVVTDSAGAIVLINPAAERFLGKSRKHIMQGGFDNLFDDPALIRKWLAEENKMEGAAHETGSHALKIYVSTIHAEEGNVIGSACLLRDITAEKRLENELLRLSTTDALTNLYNRRHLDATLRKEFLRSERNAAPLSVILLDVDHFKKFNDTYGHDQGDRVLKAVALAMRRALRKYDVPCRYGGEEFVGILPNTPPNEALAVAERLREAIAAMDVDGLRVTISLGVATYPYLRTANGEALLEAADAALYRSKEAGRNRATLAGIGEGTPA